MSLVAARDFTLCFHHDKTLDGSIRMFAFSVDHINDMVPEDSSVVRGNVVIGGWYLQPVDENNTKLTYISEVDLKGSIPGFIVK